MFSLLLRNLFFTILQPGVVAGLIPYLLLKDKWDTIFATPFHIHQFAALLVFGLGLMIMLYCIYMFAKIGRGTLSPADQTKELVIEGLYRYSRNPMYVGVILMLIGEAWFASADILWFYAGGIFGVFHLFILLIEEPRLKRDFAEAYAVYCRKVGRWI
jgi:protein-S-isoprenylcysteine O-methyltransferase Ste14